MDAGVLSTISALAGTAIGALSTLASNWMTSASQAKSARLAREREERERVYGQFMEVLAQLYAGALKSTGVNFDLLSQAYAINGRIALHATQPVTDAANAALRFIVDIAMTPPQSDAETRALMDRPEADVITLFARACREELAALR